MRAYDNVGGRVFTAGIMQIVEATTMYKVTFVQLSHKYSIRILGCHLTILIKIFGHNEA
jgi:hypothetical protein